MVDPADPADPARPPPAPVQRAAPRLESVETPSLFERARASPITAAITAINISLFVYAEYYGGGTMNLGTLLRFGAVEPFHVWAGEYWRLATSMFLHVGVVHIAVNTYMSISWSTTLERELGKARFLLIYLLSGIGGSCVSVIAGFQFGPHVAAGASGAVFGVVGATLAVRRRQFPDNRTFFANRGVRSIALQFGLLTLAGQYLHFDNAAHVGGLIMGGLLGTIVTSRAPRYEWLAFAATFALLFTVTVRPWWSPSGEYKDKIAAYANSYLTGNGPPYEKPFVVDVPRGVRFAEKGCAHSVGLACAVLAEHLDQTGDPAVQRRAEELHRRACELEPALCLQTR
jgi:membrane associated rhomboid family serine protease